MKGLLRRKTDRPSLSKVLSLPCLSASEYSAPGRIHQFDFASNGELLPSPDDHELIAELVGGNSNCLRAADQTTAAIQHRNEVKARRAVPKLRMEVVESSKPHPLMFWYTDRQIGCCGEGHYWSFVPAVRHALGTRHLATQFNVTAEMLDAAQHQIGDPTDWDGKLRPATSGQTDYSEYVLTTLWRYGIDPTASDMTRPWTKSDFPDALVIACEIGQAYTWPSIKRAFDIKQLRDDEGFDPEDLANLMLGRKRGLKFDEDFENRITSSCSSPAKAGTS